MDGENPEAEADLLMCSDGVTYLCEVKSSWASLQQSDLNALASLAERLNPDVAVLAVMQSGTRQRAAIENTKAHLSELNISFELMTLDSEPLSDGSFLHHD